MKVGTWRGHVGVGLLGGLDKAKILTFKSRNGA
jgi:hypothetical protein